MTEFALTLVLASAFLHATWNLFAKRAGGGAAFIWLADVLSVAFYAPLAIAITLLQRPRIGGIELLFIGGSSVLHLAYFLLLFRGYRSGDLSLVYPLARGTGPVLSTLAAILFFGEHPTAIAFTGAMLVALGVFVLTSGPRALGAPGASAAIAYGLLTGVLIAAYTLWDKQAVSGLLIPPLLQYYFASVGRVALLGPLALRQKAQVREEWRAHKGELLGVALLSPLSYVLFLTALVFTPVSYVAPAREISILIAAVIGARVLSESNTVRRFLAAGTMVLGVIALSVG